MTNNEMLRIRINQRIDSYTPEQLEALARVLDPKVKMHPLKEKPIDASTDYIELPRLIADEVMATVKKAFPEYRLDWSDGKTPLQRQIDATIERMTGGGKSV